MDANDAYLMVNLLKSDPELYNNWLQFDKVRRAEWAVRAAQALQRELPQMYSWKRKPSVKQIRKIIDDEDAANRKNAYLGGCVDGRRIAFEHMFFGGDFNALAVMGCSPNGRYSGVVTEEHKRKVKAYCRDIQSCLAIPLVCRDAEMVKKLKRVLFLYQKMPDEVAQQFHNDHNSQNHATDHRLVIKLYNHLKQRIKCDHPGHAKHYGNGAAKTIGFLNQLVFDLLPNQKDLTPKKVKQIFLEK